MPAAVQALTALTAEPCCPAGEGACISERDIRANISGPRHPDDVIHDLNEVEDLGKAADVFGRVSIRFSEGRSSPHHTVWYKARLMTLLPKYEVSSK